MIKILTDIFIPEYGIEERKNKLLKEIKNNINKKINDPKYLAQEAKEKAKFHKAVDSAIADIQLTNNNLSNYINCLARNNMKDNDTIIQVHYTDNTVEYYSTEEYNKKFKQ